MQPYLVALHDEPQRFCVVFQPYDNPAVSFPAQDGSDGSVDAPSRKDEAGDVAAASMLTSFGAPAARKACPRSALGLAIPLAGC